MIQCYKRIFSFILVISLFAGIGMTSLAAESSVIYKGQKNGFEFEPGSVYTETDLFENFKNVMPGDTLSETVTVKNDYKGCDYIKVWMGGLLHDQTGNPISPKVLEDLSADDRKTTMSELEYMHDFLKQLTLTVWKGEKKDSNIIYQGKPDSLENGFEKGNVYLGSFKYNESIKLNVELAVDIEMGNEYADRIGEVDWVFVIEEHNNPDSPDKEDEPEVYPYIPGTTTPTKTGDSANIVLWAGILVVAGGVAVYVMKKSKRK